MPIHLDIEEFLKSAGQIGAAQYQGLLEGEQFQQKQQMQQLQQQRLMEQMQNQSALMQSRQETLGLQQDKFGLSQQLAEQSAHNQQNQTYGRIATDRRLSGDTEGAAQMDALQLGGSGQRAPANPDEQRSMLIKDWMSGQNMGADPFSGSVPQGWAPPSSPGRYPYPGQGGAPGGEITAQPDIRKDSAAALTRLQRILEEGSSIVFKDPALKQQWDTTAAQAEAGIAYGVHTPQELQILNAAAAHLARLMTSGKASVAAEVERERANKVREADAVKKEAAAAQHQNQVARQQEQHWRQLEGDKAADRAFREREFAWRQKAHNETLAKSKANKVFSDGETKRLTEWEKRRQNFHTTYNSLEGKYKNELPLDFNPLYPEPKNAHQMELSDAYLGEKAMQDAIDKAFKAKGLPLNHPKIPERPAPKGREIDETTPGPKVFGIFSTPDVHHKRTIPPPPRRGLGGDATVAPQPVPTPTKTPAGKPNRYHSMSDDELIKPFLQH